MNKEIISILEIIDIETGIRKTLHEFETLIEAPNWNGNKQELLYNSNGKMYTYSLIDGEINLLNTGYCINCNNDHVLSFDGSILAVSHFTTDDYLSRIYTINIDTGIPTLITPIGPSYLHGLSPDNKTLAYCAERNNQYDIYTIPITGGIEKQLTFTDGLNDGPEYSPCGQYIWFNSVRTGLMQIYKMKSNGENQIQMTYDESNNWFPHISPDGKLVAFITYNKGDVDPSDHPANKNVKIQLMSSEGGKSRTIALFFGGQGSLNVNSWSPDSKKLAFVSYRLK